MKNKVLLVVIPALLALSSCQSTPLIKDNPGLDNIIEDTDVHDEIFGESGFSYQLGTRKTLTINPISTTAPMIGIQTKTDDKGTVDTSDDTISIRFVAAIDAGGDLASATAVWTRVMYNANGTVLKASANKTSNTAYTSIASPNDIENDGIEDDILTIDAFNTAQGTSFTHFVVYSMTNINLATYGGCYLNAYVTVNGDASKVVSTTVDQSFQIAFNQSSNNFFLTGTIGGEKKDVAQEVPTNGSNAASFVSNFATNDNFVVIQRTNSEFHVWDGSSVRSDKLEPDFVNDSGKIKAVTTGQFRLYLNTSDEVWASDKYGAFTNYYVRGTAANGWDDFLVDTYRFVTDPFNKGILLNAYLETGDFKISGVDWASYNLGHDRLTGGAASSFSLANPNDIHCNYPGYYNFYLTNDDYISIEYGMGLAPVVNQNNNTVSYGLYPQTLISDASLIEKLEDIVSPKFNNWYLYAGEYYAYDDGLSSWFKCEPIVWDILNKDGNDYFLLAKSLLDTTIYDETSNNYADSDIRNWLNTSFYNTAFYLEDDYNKVTSVNNSASTTDNNENAYACSNTEDKVLLLSYQDYRNTSYGFPDTDAFEEERKCQVTDYAKAKGAYQSSNNGCYFTRSPASSGSNKVSYVNYGGRILTVDVNIAQYCIRPAITITTSQAAWTHYPAVSATGSRHGSSEFWKRNADNHISYTRPASQLIEDSDFSVTDDFYNLTDADPRYIAPTSSRPIDNGDGTVTYGIYPQTVLVNSDGLYDTLNANATLQSNGWYEYHSEYYAKVQAGIRGSSPTFENGTSISEGSWYWFKCEPITWNKLPSSDSDGNYYLLANKILDRKKYSELWDDRVIGVNTIHTNNYEYSYVRAWLNGYDGSSYSVPNFTNVGFFQTAFILNDSFVQDTTVDNSAAATNTNDNPYVCDNTVDKVFMPSYQDYRNASYGFNSDEARVCYLTDWAKVNNADIGEHDDCGTYWTRSPGNNSQNYAFAIENGFSDYGTFNQAYAQTDFRGVRPAITITM